MCSTVTFARPLMFVALAMTPWLGGCGGTSEELPKASIPSENAVAGSAAKPANSRESMEPVQLVSNEEAAQSPAKPTEKSRPVVLIKTTLGDIQIELDTEKSPRTVENFLYNYVERRFYDQTIVHYVEGDYMLAAGGFDVKYEPKEPRTPILCEADNGLKNRKGTIAMARHPEYANSATSQFFINLVDNTSLDYQPQDDGKANGYCVFGKVIQGMDVVEKIGQVPVHDQGEFDKTPVTPVVIEQVRRVK